MSTTAEIIAHIIDRDLRGFIREIEAYPDEASVWALPAGVANSAGTLALHCAGNLQHFIGARLGGSGFVRDRDREFNARSVTRAELTAGLERARDRVRNALLAQRATPLPDTYPDPLNGQRVPTEVFLIHLAVHLTYHLGQVDYHRRITTGEGKTADAIPVRELPFMVPA